MAAKWLRVTACASFSEYTHTQHTHLRSPAAVAAERNGVPVVAVVAVAAYVCMSVAASV